MQGYCDVYKWTILKRTSPEVKCLHPTSSSREMCMSSVSNVIYHKFSHGAVSYTLNRENVYVMLEFTVFYQGLLWKCKAQFLSACSVGKVNKSALNMLKGTLKLLISQGKNFSGPREFPW